MKSFLSLLLAATFILGCDSDGSGGSDQADTQASTGVDGTDAADGTDGTESSDGTDGATGEIPDCVFKPPVGATCNPYPSCPGSGCAVDEVCTLTLQGTAKRIACQADGEAGDGDPCDIENGPLCQAGTCVDGFCRGFCVDNNECPSNSACQPLPGVPGKPTVCGAPKADCDPLDPSETCPNGLSCYLLSNAFTDCLTQSGAGGQDSPCTEPNECAEGFTCTTYEEQKICARVCSAEEGHPLTCGAVCTEGQSLKTLSDTLAACVPSPDVEPPPPPPSCSALAQDCEAPAQACYPTNQGEVCLQEGTKPAGAQCNSVNECDEGLMCVASKCRIICDPEDPLNEKCESGVNAKCAAPAGATSGYCDE